MEHDIQTSEDDFTQNEKDNNMEVDTNILKKGGNPRLADALAKAIRMGKSKKGKSVVLSKAKLHTSKPLKKALSFEIVSDPNKDIKKEVDIKLDVENVKPSKKELKKLKITKQEKFQRGRIKPSPLDREKERPLVKIATRGVVQLFNAVRQQQSAINKQINKPGLTEGRKEKILRSIDKKSFLDVLMGKTRSEREPDSNVEMLNISENDVKSEPEDEVPSWKVLREDFMMGAKLKDWDKKDIEVMEER